MIATKPSGVLGWRTVTSDMAFLCMVSSCLHSTGTAVFFVVWHMPTHSEFHLLPSCSGNSLQAQATLDTVCALRGTLGSDAGFHTQEDIMSQACEIGASLKAGLDIFGRGSNEVLLMSSADYKDVLNGFIKYVICVCFVCRVKQRRRSIIIDRKYYLDLLDL